MDWLEQVNEAHRRALAAGERVKEVQARIDDAGRHLECSIYEREDVQDYLRYLRAATEEP